MRPSSLGTRKKASEPEAQQGDKSQNWRERQSRQPFKRKMISRQEEIQENENLEEDNEQEEDSYNQDKETQDFLGAPFAEVQPTSKAPLVRKIIREDNDTGEGPERQIIPEQVRDPEKNSITKKQIAREEIKKKATEIVKRILDTPLETLLRELAGLSPVIRVELHNQLKGNKMWQLMTIERKIKIQRVLHQGTAEGVMGQLKEVFLNTEFPRQVLKIKKIPEVQAYAASDPYNDYLEELPSNQVPAPPNFVLGSEAHKLRTVNVVINSTIKRAAIIDSGSEIVTMSEATAIDAGISWDPDHVINVQSANSSVAQSLGLAHNVPFRFKSIVIYLQVHVIKTAAYDVLLGRPFDCITKSSIQNNEDGSQVITLTDPNTKKREVIPTQERMRTMLQTTVENDTFF